MTFNRSAESLGEMHTIMSEQPPFVHVAPHCKHEFEGWRVLPNGGEQVCKHCGIGAMPASMREGE